MALVANSSSRKGKADEKAVMERLKKLGAGGAGSNSLDVPLRESLSRMRSTHVNRMTSGPASAEFFVLFAPGATAPRIEGVKFLKGSEKLKTAEKAIMAAKFDAPFPVRSGARILRRGILFCSSGTVCEFVLMTPDTVWSVE